MKIFRCSQCGRFNRISGAHEGTPVCGRCKAQLDTTGATTKVTSSQLADLIATSPVPLLVDFWATWCGPCRVAAPMLDQIARHRAGSLIVVKVDVDAEPVAAAGHRVRSMPSFVLFDQGREIGRQIGLLPRAHLDAWLDQRITHAIAS